MNIYVAVATYLCFSLFYVQDDRFYFEAERAPPSSFFRQQMARRSVSLHYPLDDVIIDLLSCIYVGRAASEDSRSLLFWSPDWAMPPQGMNSLTIPPHSSQTSTIRNAYYECPNFKI